MNLKGNKDASLIQKVNFDRIVISENQKWNFKTGEF